MGADADTAESADIFDPEPCLRWGIKVPVEDL
jgi:hypothetical protein